MTQEVVAGATTQTVSITVNGERVSTEVEGDETLLETLRERLGYTSSRGTCQIGVCGTCTVLVDGKSVSSCIMLTAHARDREVTTAEGLRDTSGALSELQQAFVRKGAYQCSFCIPAMVLSAHEALSDNSVDGDVESVREHLAGNLCRCGTYPEILEAVADLVGTNKRSEDEGT